MAEQLNVLVGKTVTFLYSNSSEERTVDVESVKDCANGSTLVVGKDHNRNMDYRSFNANKMSILNMK